MFGLIGVEGEECLFVFVFLLEEQRIQFAQERGGRWGGAKNEGG